MLPSFERFKDEPGFTRVATLEEIRAKGLPHNNISFIVCLWHLE